MLRRFRRERRVREESEDAQPVVHGDDYYALVREMLPILPCFRGAASGKAAAVDPHHHRQLGVLVLRGGPHIQREAIFADARIAKDHIRIELGLYAVCAKAGGLARAVPLRRRLRRFPAQRANRWSGEGDPEEGAHLSIRALLALHLAAVGLHAQRIAGMRRARQHQCRQCRRHSHLSRTLHAVSSGPCFIDAPLQSGTAPPSRVLPSRDRSASRRPGRSRRHSACAPRSTRRRDTCPRQQTQCPRAPGRSRAA